MSFTVVFRFVFKMLNQNSFIRNSIRTTCVRVDVHITDSFHPLLLPLNPFASLFLASSLSFRCNDQFLIHSFALSISLLLSEDSDHVCVGFRER